MKANVNDVYILTPAELTVIAAGKNIQGMFGIQNTESIVDETAVCQALNHLYQKEFISNADGTGFLLDVGLRELMTAIEEAKSIIMIRYFAEITSIKVIYVGSRLVATEQRAHDMKAIRIFEIPKESLGDFLQEDVLEEEQAYRPILDEEHVILEGMQKKHALSVEEIESMGNIVIVVEKMAPKGKKVCCRMIAKQEKKWLKYTQKKKELESLEKEAFFDNVVKMVKEEFDDIS